MLPNDVNYTLIHYTDIQLKFTIKKCTQYFS